MRRAAAVARTDGEVTGVVGSTVGGGPPFVIEDPDTVVDDGLVAIEDEPTLHGGIGADEGAGDGPPTIPAGAPPEPVEVVIPRDAAQIAALVDEARGVVDRVARSVARLVGYREVPELCSVGRAALVEAARVHEAGRTPFVSFAAQKMRWAMIDHVRREGHARGARRRAHAVAASDLVAEVRGSELAADGRPPELPTEETARDALSAALARHAEALAVGLVIAERRGPVPDPALDPEHAVTERRAHEQLHAAVARLPERQRTIVERYYFEEERLERIAESIGVSKSWASRLHAQALAQLGRALRES